MKRLLILGLTVLMVLNSCDVFEQLNEVKRFVSCKFTINEVQISKLGGIDFTRYNSVKEIGFTETLSLGQQVLSGKLPAHLSVDIRATNNDMSKASISGLDWQLFMKNEQYGAGKLNQYVEVLPGKSKDFRVVVNFDLLKLIKSKDLQLILDLVTDIDNKEKLQKLDIMLKVKPYYKSGDNVREYPGFLTIRP
jgi:hypothetical protein